jgi:hypothetical protein
MSKIEVFAIAVVLSYVSFMGAYLKTSELATRPNPEGSAIAAELPTNEQE